MCYAIFLPRPLPLSVHNLYNFHSIIDPPTLCLLCFQLKWMHKIRYCYAIAQTSHTDTLRGILPQLPRMPLMMPRQTLYNIASTSPTRTHYNLISPATLTNNHTNTTTPITIWLRLKQKGMDESFIHHHHQRHLEIFLFFSVFSFYFHLYFHAVQFRGGNLFRIFTIETAISLCYVYICMYSSCVYWDSVVVYSLYPCTPALL